MGDMSLYTNTYHNNIVYLARHKQRHVSNDLNCTDLILM